MTTSEPANEGPVPPENQPKQGSNPPSGELAGSSIPAATSVSNDEDLPDWEPLTPELVEDEAIRGDFVIRWAVVGIALLFGFATISETRTLVHIRTGEYLAAHGILPPATDVFSYTADGRHWVNLPWMFDLVAAGIHRISGGIGLSVMQGLLAGLAFGLLVHATRRGIRTWWGSICAVLALLACYPQFTIQPELITILGLCVVLWLVVNFEESGKARALWISAAVIWLWSQFDSRAFLGWVLLASMAAGESLRRSEGSGSRRALWWKVAATGFLATVLHPFHVQSLLSAWRVYAVDYPALRHLFPRPGSVEIGFHPITSPLFWNLINHDSIAAFILLAATIVALLLNRERLHPGHVVAVVVFNLLACFATHELAAASLVNCVIGTLNAQSWYRHRFGQVYSVDWRELLFSRGGRALTVVSFFVLAWLVISGRIDGPAGRRTSLGFEEALQVQMDSYRQMASQEAPDDRPFHFAARQGDLLIWGGLKSFVDTRAGLFGGTADQDLIGEFDRTRRALQRQRKNQAGSGEPEIWKGTFEKYQITHVMPRLSGPMPPPDYLTFFDLLSTGEWVLTDLNASTAVLYREESPSPVREFVASHRLDAVRIAFREPQEVPETGRVCAKAETLSDSLFSVRAPRSPDGVQQASHFDQLALADGNIPPMTRVAYALLAIRRANSGLREDPNAADGYRTLALSYLVLDRIETGVMHDGGKQWFSPVRFYQTLGALHQAALLRPDDALLRAELLQVFDRTQRRELALDCIRQIKRIRPMNPDSPEQQRLIDVEYRLEEELARVETEVAKGLDAGADRYQAASAAYQAGAVKLAVKTLEDDPIYKEQHPLARSQFGMWLIELGRIQEGLEALEQSTALGDTPGWRNSLATSLLINADYARAIELWQSEIAESETNSGQSTLLTLPFLTLNPIWMSADQFPITHTAAAAELLGKVRADNGILRFQIGMAQLEQGDLIAARKSLQEVLANPMATDLKPLLKFYLQALSEKPIEEQPGDNPPAGEEREKGLELEEFGPLNGGEVKPAGQSKPAAATGTDPGAKQ